MSFRSLRVDASTTLQDDLFEIVKKYGLHSRVGLLYPYQVVDYIDKSLMLLGTTMQDDASAREAKFLDDMSKKSENAQGIPK